MWQYELSPRFHVADAETRRSGVPAGLNPPRMDTHAGGTLCRYFTKFSRIQTDRCGLALYAVILLLRWIDIDLQSRVYFG
jgi:hypothetical protein